MWQIPGEPEFSCAFRLDQALLSGQVKEELRTLEEERPQLVISSRW
jgi:hypothetical protein